MDSYENSLEHLMDELRRIELRVRFQVLRFRMTGGGGPDAFKGLCIRDDEIDTILKQPLDFEHQIDSSQFKTLQGELAELEAKIRESRCCNWINGVGDSSGQRQRLPRCSDPRAG